MSTLHPFHLAFPVTSLAKARAEAVRRNEVVYLSLVTHNSMKQLDNSCALTAGTATASWVVSKENPAGLCKDVNADASPFVLARQAQGDGSPNVTVSVRQPSGSNPCGGASSANRVGFNGYGRVQPEPAAGSGWGSGPLQCIVVDSSAGAVTHPLNIIITSGGTVRMCDPAVTASTDPRRC